MTDRAFPDGFLWGVATAGHQNEGNNSNSDTWFLENVSPTIFKERSGLACNTWELWETDLDLAKGLGLNAFRFSVEWARIEPTEGQFDDAALAHYEAVVDGCLARGLAPVVTLNHFTSPHWFACKGAWLDAGSLFRSREGGAFQFGDEGRKVRPGQHLRQIRLVQGDGDGDPVTERLHHSAAEPGEQCRRLGVEPCSLAGEPMRGGEMV